LLPKFRPEIVTECPLDEPKLDGEKDNTGLSNEKRYRAVPTKLETVNTVRTLPGMPASSVATELPHCTIESVVQDVVGQISEISEIIADGVAFVFPKSIPYNVIIPCAEFAVLTGLLWVNTGAS
jgi:hypothetical protein